MSGLLAAAGALGYATRGTHTDRISQSWREATVVFATLFLGSALAVAALLASKRLLLGWLRPRSALPPERRRVAWVYAVLGLLGLACCLWGRFVETSWIVERRTSLALPGVRNPIRLVVFSDLHSDPRFDLDPSVARRVNDLHPDVLLFLGDSLSCEERAPSFRQALAAMHARVAKLAIRGNWDAWYWDDIELFAGTGFDEVVAGWRSVAVDQTVLRIGGHGWRDDFAPAAVVTAPPPGPGPAIFLYHANDYIPTAASAGIDLYLCGDTHGGQIALPGLGPIFAVGRQGLKYVRGLYQVLRVGAAPMQAYVTPGLGVERSFPVRFGVRPEITVLDLVAGDAGGPLSEDISASKGRR